VDGWGGCDGDPGRHGCECRHRHSCCWGVGAKKSVCGCGDGAKPIGDLQAQPVSNGSAKREKCGKDVKFQGEAKVCLDLSRQVVDFFHRNVPAL
jgi:hypothetical protein